MTVAANPRILWALLPRQSVFFEVAMKLNQTLTRWLAPGLCLVTLLCALVSGLHHHRPEADHGACVACAAGHSPAIPAAATIASTPRPALEQAVPASFRAAPSPAEFRCVSPRAPPLG